MKNYLNSLPLMFYSINQIFIYVYNGPWQAGGTRGDENSFCPKGLRTLFGAGWLSNKSCGNQPKLQCFEKAEKGGLTYNQDQ